MAVKLPDPATALGERPTPRPRGNVAGYQVQTDESGAIIAQAGRVMERVGARIQATSEEIFRQVRIEEERIDTLKAEEAFTALRTRQIDLTSGLENGFKNLRGSDAMGRPLLDEWTKRFEDASREIEGKLANDNQKRKFQERALVAGRQYQNDIFEHLRHESDAYAKQVFEGTVTTELRYITERWNNALDVELSLERVHAAIRDRAERLGWAPEYTEAVRLEQFSKAHAAVIRQAIASDDYLYAQQWYEANKAEIDSQTAQVVQRAVEDGVQKEVFASYQREYLSGQDSQQVLRALERRVVDDGAIDDTRKNVLLGRILGRIQVLEHRDELERERTLRRVERAIGEVNANTLAGFESSPDQMAPIIAAAKGTELEAEAARMASLARQTSGFRNAPPAAQEQMLTSAESALRKDPGKFDRRVLEAWRSIYEGQRRAVRESPVTFAVRQGLVDPNLPGARPLDLANPNQIGEQLASRFAIARDMRARYGSDLKPLTPEEATLLTASLRRAGVPEQREYLAALSRAAGDDREGYSAIMAQIAPDEPVIAIAGDYAARGRTQAAELMLRGQAAMRPNRKADGTPDTGKLLPMPAERDMRRIFDNRVRDAYAGMPTARSQHEQAARAIYMAISVDAGDKDTSVLDVDRWEQAIDMATGGMQDYRGRRILMPWGYTFSQFRDGLARRVEDLASSGRLDAVWTSGRLLELPLESAGDGKYVLRSGDAELVDRSGRRVIIDFNTASPFKTSGWGLDPQRMPTAGELAEASKAVTGRALPRPDRQKKVARK